MNISMIVEMAADGGGDRLAVGPLSYGALVDLARRAATRFQETAAETVALVDVNSETFPVVLWGAAMAGLPFAPINYRWDDDQLRRALGRIAPAVVIADPASAARIKGVDGIEVIERDAFMSSLPDFAAAGEAVENEKPAVLLFTSGTSGDPKVAVLHHDNLVSYIFGTVEFMGADPAETQLVSVPPYHIAGIANLLSAVYAGRRVVYLPSFDPDAWVSVARQEAVTHAMVVPTMLGRILEVLDDAGLPALRHLSYGGGRMPLPVIEAAVSRLPEVGFVNAYGLTETSSTVAVLGPDDHRMALASSDEAVRRRLGSVGQPLPTIEVSIRDEQGNELPPGDVGEIWVRGEQVSGEYLGVGSTRNADGWFPTKDGGSLDADGYLFVEGRLDDVIVRGGENISPGEVEDALLNHPAVTDAAVVGVPDDEWGEAVVAAVVVSEPVEVAALQEWVRGKLRSSKVPARIEFLEALPYNDNGKLVRRELRARLT